MNIGKQNGFTTGTSKNYMYTDMLQNLVRFACKKCCNTGGISMFFANRRLLNFGA
jgi:hypothetical protein